MEKIKQDTHGQFTFGNIKLVLGESDLAIIIRQYIHDWAPETYFFKVPVIGNIKNELKSLSLADLQIKSDGIHLRLYCQLHASNQRRVPSFQLSGTLEVMAHINLQLLDNLQTDFQIDILDFQWKRPPLIKVAIFTLTSKRQISKLMESRIPDLEAKILKAVMEAIALKDLVTKQLKSCLPVKLNQKRYVNVSNGKISYGQINYQKSSMTLLINGEFIWETQRGDYSMLQKNWIYFTQSTIPERKTSICIPVSDLNTILPEVLPFLNNKIQKSRLTIKRTSLSITPPYLNLVIYLEGLIDDFFEIKMFVQLDEENQKLLLKDFHIKHVSESSMLMKGMLFLFKGKLENLVYEYFPLDIKSIFNRIENQINKQRALDFQFDIEGLKLTEFMLEANRVCFTFDHNSTLSIPEKSKINLFVDI